MTQQENSNEPYEKNNDETGTQDDGKSKDEDNDRSSYNGDGTMTKALMLKQV